MARLCPAKLKLFTHKRLCEAKPNGELPLRLIWIAFITGGVCQDEFSSIAGLSQVVPEQFLKKSLLNTQRLVKQQRLEEVTDANQ